MRLLGLARLVLIISSSLIFSATRAQMAGSYTINPAQPAGPTNFQSFNQAVSALKAGITGAVTINVAPGSGPYNERIHLDHTIKTSATRTLTFNCNGVTLSFLSKEGEQRAGVMIDSADYITIDSLVVIPQGVNPDEYGYGFHLLHDADYNTIQRCKIINQHNNGLELQRNDNIIINGNPGFGIDEGNSSCDNNIITRNTITGGYCGVTLSSLGDGAQMIRGNQITHNTITDFDYTAVLLNGNAEGTLIDGNDITQPNAIFAKGISMYGKNLSTVISNNRIHKLYNIYGLPITAIFTCSEGEAGKETVIANNLIYDLVTGDEQNGIEIRYGAPASYVKILHNTIVLDNSDPSNSFATYGINIGANSHDIQIFDNIIYVTRETASENYGLQVESYTPNLDADNNNWYIASSSASVNAIAYLEGLQLFTLSDWQGATGLDLNSTSIDPLFTDVTTGEFKPLEGSFDNKGRPMGITRDVIGLTRNSTAPDVGAYEFDGPPCSSPVAGTSSGLPATVTCESQSVILTLHGNNNGVGQTYQWQSDPNPNGSFSTIVNAEQAAPAFEIRPTSTLYYRAAVTCGATKVYSDPILIEVNPALAAGTYTIDPSQPAGGSNFQSMQDAITAMHCGVRGHVVFNVAPGTYNEQVTIPVIPGTSASKTITFNGQGATFSFVPFISEERNVFKLDGVDYVTLDSFNIEIPTADDNGFGFGIQITNGADHNTIRNSTISNNTTSNSFNYAGIVITAPGDMAVNVVDASYCDSNTISNNTIIGGYYGITSTSSQLDAMSENNVIINNIIKENYGYGVYLANTDNTTVAGNEIHRVTRANSYAEYSGIFASSRNPNLKIGGNRIHNLSTGDPNSNAQLSGINLWYSIANVNAPQMVSNNALYHFNGTGLQQALAFNSATHVQFYNNTISLEDSTVNSSEPARGLAVYGSATTGLVFKNNNITMKRLGTGIKHCVFMVPGTSFTSDNNNFYPSGDNSTVGIRAGVSYATLGDWKTGTGTDAKSFSIKPVYNDPAQGDFTPTVVALDDKGTWVGNGKDINGNNRSATKPDIGAFEFTICPTLPAMQMEVDSQAVCINEPVTLKVKDPQPNTTYSWYNDETSLDTLFTGTSRTENQVTTPVVYWVEAVTPRGCTSAMRARVKVVSLEPLEEAPQVETDSITVKSIVFVWEPVPEATRYEVSQDGVQFSTPSSGPEGLSHRIENLKPNDTVSIIVRALGSVDCLKIESARILGQTKLIPFYIPNTFTPNGNGQNDDFRVYSNGLRSMHLIVYNQWGQKVFETTDPNAGWDGTFNGKPQPVGVYAYVAKMFFADGTSEAKKGTINLVR